MEYIKSVELNGGRAKVMRLPTTLSVYYFGESSSYVGIVRDDVKPATILEFARDTHLTALPNPKDFRPPLDKLLAAFPDAPDDAKQLIDVLYSSN